MKQTLLLHSCCAPCSSSVIEKLQENFDITVFYYNPNIFPASEFDKRKNEQETYLSKLGIKIIVGEYNPQEYYNAINGLENQKEHSQRCYKCYEFRIKKTFELAQKLGFNFFTTTLSVSPHKNASWINQIGKSFQTKQTKFLESNFKKQNGYLRSLILSKENNFYRQNYCGCEMSFLNRKNLL